MSKSKFSFKDFYEKHQVWLHCIFVMIAAFLVGWLSLIFMDIWTRHGETTTVPGVVGQNYEEACDLLESKDFKVEIDSIYDEEAAYGQVLAQSPIQGEEVKFGRTIYLKINSTHPQMVEFSEDIRHVSSINAKNILGELGFSNITIKTEAGENDDEVVEITSNGRPVRIGTKLPITSKIVLTVTFTNKEEVDTMSVDDANLLLNDSSMVVDDVI